MIDHTASSWPCSFLNLSVSVCFPLTHCVADQAHHPLDRLLTADTLHPSNGTSFAPLLIFDLMPALFSRGTCAATAVTASVTKNFAVQDSRREVHKHSRFPVTHGSGLRAPNSHLLYSVICYSTSGSLVDVLTCTIVPRVTGLVFVARVMTPAIVFRDCLDNTSCSHSISRAYVPPSAESSKDSSVFQLVSCFCRHRDSWSVGTPRQASPCTDRPVSEIHGAIIWSLFCVTAILAHTPSG